MRKTAASVSSTAALRGRVARPATLPTWTASAARVAFTICQLSSLAVSDWPWRAGFAGVGETGLWDCGAPVRLNSALL